MNIPNLDELDRGRFTWPEPLVIELICDQYAGRVPVERRMDAARLHEKMLRAVLEERPADHAILRNRLSEVHGVNGLGPDVMAEIDSAVFYELVRLVGARFRLSPRLRDAFGQRLQLALSQIASAAPPVAGSAWRKRPPLALKPAACGWLKQRVA